MTNHHFLGSYTRRESKGIYRFDENLHLVAELENPTYLAQKDGILYSIFGGEQGCGLAVYNITEDGDLKLVQKVYSDEKGGPCHISVDDNHEIAVTSNYGEHCFHVYRKLNGQWQEPTRVDIIEEGSHVHYAHYSNITNVLYVTDLGTDKVYLYHLDDLSKPYHELLFPKGCGVRHCVFNHDEKMMFVLSEYSGEIFSLYENKIISQVKTNTNHEFNEGGAAIRLSNDEKYLAVSLRTKNQIIIYENEDGFLTKFQVFSTYGEHPRDFNFIDDETILCANRDTNNLTVFKCDPISRKYQFVKTVDAPEIVCVSI